MAAERNYSRSVLAPASTQLAGDVENCVLGDESPQLHHGDKSARPMLLSGENRNRL